MAQPIKTMAELEKFDTVNHVKCSCWQKVKWKLQDLRGGMAECCRICTRCATKLKNETERIRTDRA